MTDSCTKILLAQLHRDDQKTLLIADENTAGAVDTVSSSPSLEIITNRFDVYSQCLENNHCSHFSDFDFSPFSANSYDLVLYRISKEKPTSHHIINSAYLLLRQGGTLILSGEKNEGIKSYTKNAAELFGKKASPAKHGSVYLSHIVKTNEQTETLLDTKEYTKVRPIHETEIISLHSKPGVFGWNKIDQGSTLLLTTAERYLCEKQRTPKTLLDLGCGYGYISIATKTWDFIEARSATDNNAAAIACIKRNADINNIHIDISADDCATNLNQRFELILCNPPFHQGFDIDESLTKKFLTQTRSHLRDNGVALFVVNRFIAIQKLSAPLFSKVEEIADNNSFKVYALTP